MECKQKFTMCRLCLSESESLIEIFQVHEWVGYVPADIIADLLQLKVSEKDGYPHVVCTICFDKLTDFKQFKQQCQNSRHTYDNVFASDEIHDEHPIDIEYSDPIKSEEEEEKNSVSPAIEEYSDPIKSEGEEETNYVSPTIEEYSDPIKSEEEEEMKTVSIAIEVRKSDIAFTSQEYLAGDQRKMCRDSYASFQSGVIDDGKPFSTKMEQVDKSDLNGVETCAGDLRIEKIQSEEAMECVDTVVDDTPLGNEGVVNIRTESEKETAGGSGEEDPLVIRETVGKGELLRCKECGKDFEKDLFERHMELHVEELNAGRNCEGNDLEVDCRCKRNMNELFKGGLKPFSCALCNKVFKCKLVLSMHLMNHTTKKPYMCETCGMQYAKQSCLTLHKRKHGKDKPFTCSVCKKVFKSQSVLSVHLVIHTGERPYMCEICGNRFTQKSSLVKHRKIHNKEKPYACKVCGFRVSRKDNLAVHMRVHSRVYECETCGINFSRKDRLITHTRSHIREKRK